MTEAEQRQYIAEMMAKLDEGSRIATAIDKGKEEGKSQGLSEGLAKGKAEVAKAMKEKGLAVEMICEVTGLSQEAIDAL